MNTTDLRNQTPAQIDETMIRLQGKLANLETIAQRYGRLLDSDGWKTEQNITDWTAKVAQAVADAQPVQADLQAIDAEFTARGGWTRYWMVCNANGHIHSSLRCSTCRPTTEFTLVFQVSGMTEAEVIDLAGVRVCTVCYPEAPVDVLARPSRLPYDVEARRVAEEKKAAQDAKKAAQDAKNLVEPVKLSGRFGDTIKTVRAARIEAVDCLVRVAEREHIPNKDAVRSYIVDYRIVVEAIAKKEGVTVQELGAEFAPKVARKVKANAKAAEKFRAANPWMFETAE